MKSANSHDEDTTDLGQIEYWAQELALPLHGISDTNRFSCRDDFLCLYQNNVSTLYFINNRYERDAQTGYRYFSSKDSVEKYARQAQRALKAFDSLKSQELSRPELMKLAHLADRVYDMTEAVRFKKFEGLDDTQTWYRFKDIAKWRLEIRQAFDLFYPHANKAMETIAKTYKVSRDDLFFYTYHELEALTMHGEKVRRPVVTARKKGYIYWIKDGHSNLIVGKRFKLLASQLSRESSNHSLQELSGNSISRQGLVRGRVQLVLHNKKRITLQTNKFKAGSILVTEMVRPESIMVCRRAKAIVTDEGGIISHAAIVARELGLPCIMGTKIATKVLKDGDLVELDTDTGVVKVLETSVET